MPPRRRRGSTSSVEETSRKPIHWCQESSVLRAPPPGTSDDDWPIFELVDAVVLQRDGVTMANALDVLYEGPFIVRGNMIIDDAEQKRHLIMRPRPSYPLEIFSCSRYSVGEAEPDYQDVDESRTTKPPVVWVGGRGAWFEIQPSAAYLPIYRDMCEAIRLYYAIYDIYQEEGVKKLNRLSKSTDPAERLSKIFLQYAIKAGNGLTVEEVVQRCRDLAPFLITQFLQAKDDESFWKKTWFYRWLESENEDLFKKAAHAIRNPPIINSKVELPQRNKRDSASVSNRGSRTAESTEPAPSKRARRSGSGTASALEPVKISDGGDKAVSRTRSTRSRSMNQPEPQAKPQPAKVTPKSTDKQSESIAPPPEKSASASVPVPDGDDSGDILEIVEGICDDLAKKKKGKGVSKVGILNNLYFNYKFPTYKNGGPGCHRVPVEEVLHFHASTLLEGLDPAPWGDNDFYPWLQEMAETELIPVAFKLSDLPYPLVPRKKNPFQHRMSNASAADVVRAGDIPDADDDDSSSHNNFSTPKRGTKSVKTPGRLSKSVLRPAASSKKRPRPDTDDDSDLDGRDPKRSHYFSDADDTMEDADTSGTGLKVDDEDDKIKISIRADRIPSVTPRGPNGTWICDQDACTYIVRGGDAEECQRRIQEHFEEHEQQTERVQLAVTESRGHLPINHLLDKIKNLGDAAEAEEMLSIAGVELPKPIQRKLIV